jgi:hypothetical protein
MNPGKHLEKLLGLIHETIRDSELTKIYSNRKLSNTAGQLREIDILIETSINGLDIKVAIECKDYKNKVSVEKIEAFNSKCARIPAINKKVLVATSGFQKDAVFAAKDFGIELLDFKKISPSIVLSWLPLNQITGKFEFVLPMRVGLVGAEDLIDNVDLDDNFLIYFQDNRVPLRATQLISKIFTDNIAEYRALLLYKYLESGRKPNLKHTLPFNVSLKGIFLKHNNIDLVISNIHTEVISWFEEEKVKISEARDYTTNCNSIKTLTIDLDAIGKADLIFDHNKNLHIYHTTTNGMTYKLHPLFSYDPQTNSLRKI